MRFCNRIVFESRGESEESRGQVFDRSAKPASQTTCPPDSPTRPHGSPRLRDRWPFLDEPDCPVALQALITRRITCYHEYSNLYPKLRDCQTLTECADVAGRLLDAYLDNQAIFREMEYYQKHRKVLGRHPFFRHYQQLSRLRSSTTSQLFREKQRTLDNIWRVKSEIRKGDKPHLDGKRRKRLEDYTLKLQEINNLLGEK